MFIRELKKNEIESALELVLTVFEKYEAPDYSEQGIKKFYKNIFDPEYLSMLRVYGGFVKNDIVGTIATRSNGNHIASFFVSEKYQQQGIGEALLCVCHEY